MALTINKPDGRGKQQVVAEEDMYLDESGKKVIVVKQGEAVPPEAASVLAAKGGRVPARYAKMIDEAGAKAKPEAEVKSEAQAKVKAPSEASATNPPKKAEEKPAP